MYALVVADADSIPALADFTLHGPFVSVEAAQEYAEQFRAARSLPVEATPENNEAWTDAGWYFGIFPLAVDG